MNTIRVSGSCMDKDAETIRREIGKAKIHISEMLKAVEGLSSCWTGPAATVYKNQVYADIEYMTDVCGEIEAFLDSFSEAKKDYGKAESDVYRSIRRMWIW